MLRRSVRWKPHALLVALLLWALSTAPAAGAVEVSPPELDPTLSLTGDCSTNAFDPVADPSCSGEPLAYPAPPNGSSGRFGESVAITVDPFGNEYVSSLGGGGRVDVFDDEGKFVTEVAIAGPKSIAVDSGGNLYVLNGVGKILRYAPENSPEAPYEPEAGEIRYEDPPVTVASGEFVGSVSVDAQNDQLVAVQSGTITRYKDAAEGNGVLESFKPEGIGVWTDDIAVDAQRRRIYVSYCEGASTDECGVKILGADSPHAVIKDLRGPSETVEFAANQGRLGLAVDEETGDFFVADIQSVKTVYQFSEGYELLSQLKASEFQATTAIQIGVSNGTRSPSADPCGYPTNSAPPVGDACNRHYLFIPVVKPAGRALAYQPSNVGPPVIEGVSTVGIGETEAELRAVIDPNGAVTDYRFELTTQAAFEAEGFASADVVGEGAILSQGLATEVNALVDGLTTGGRYRFRVVAENEAGKGEEEGQNEAGFTTYDDASAGSDGCPNQALRVNASAQLPDCRAYELVTPTDTNGRPPRGVSFFGLRFTTRLASPLGDLVSFRIEGGSLPGTSGVGSFDGGDPYVASRGPSGWDTALAGPSGEAATVAASGSASPDQRFSFWSAREEGPAVINGEETQYLRYPDGQSQLIGRGSLGTDPKAEGRLITEDATHVLFETIKRGLTIPIQLEPDAPPSGTRVVYDRTIDSQTGFEETHVVSLLPGDVTPAAGENATYIGASRDGVGIAFTVTAVSTDTLYLRVDNETTYKIGTGIEFAGVSEGGARIFYVEAGDLKAFDVASEEVIDFAVTGDAVPVNVAADGTRAYFVSEEVLGGANPEGTEAQAGEQNLYLSEEGAISFVATVTARDVEGEPQPLGTFRHDGLGLWTQNVAGEVARDPSRLNSDGSVLLFQSRASVTGYPESEFPQIYRYDRAADDLRCISCNPSGTPPTGGASLESYTFDSFSSRPFGPISFVPNLALDGKRVFFESVEPLVSTDTNERQDVYEWEEDGVGSCNRAGGCVYLISSGQGARNNFLYSHSESGGDVFFASSEQLTGWDTSAVTSIYDARVDGGFQEPTAPDPCVADGCRPAVTAPPAASSPASAAQGSTGNVQPKKPQSTCPKGKRKVKKNGKTRCVKRKGASGKAKQRAGANRGAGK